MENQEKSQVDAKESSDSTKIVVIMFPPDGSATVRSFTRSVPPGEDFVLKDSTLINSKKFTDVPKRLEFFLEKNFKL